jgi:hypothetical protein
MNHARVEDGPVNRADSYRVQEAGLAVNAIEILAERIAK